MLVNVSGPKAGLIAALETRADVFDDFVEECASARRRIEDEDAVGFLRLAVATVGRSDLHLVRQPILQQAGASALSAANFSGQFVTQLLR